MKLEFDVAVVGGGPAGMMAAASAAKLGARTVLLEKNAKLGRKLMITGKGRCNVCNQCDVQSFIGAIPGNGRFLYSAVNRFSPLDTMDYFEGLHVPLKTERGNRVFPVSDRVRRYCGCDERRCGSFRRSCIAGRHKSSYNKRWSREGCESSFRKKNTVGQRYRSLRRAVLSWNRLNRRRISVSEAGWTYDRSAPALPGAFGLPGKLVPGATRPFLAEYCGSGDRSETRKRNLPGFRRNAFYTLWRQRSGHIKRQRSYEDLAPERYEIHIDLKPGLNFEQLDLRLQRDFQKFQNRDFSNSLQELLPKKLIPVAVNLSGIPGEKEMPSNFPPGKNEFWQVC